MFRFVIAALAILMPQMALAQDKPIAVFFQPCDVQPLNDAITAAMSQQGFVQLLKSSPEALVVSIPDKVQVEHGHVSGNSWSFTAAFSRDGSRLGQSDESCNEHKLADCTDQLMSDIKSAAGAP